MSLRDQILNSDDIDKETVTIPEWSDAEGNGAVIELRALSVTSFTEINKRARRGDDIDLRAFYVGLITEAAFDPENGELVFTEADSTALAQRSMKVIERLSKVINRLSGMNDDGDVKGAVEQEGKDS